MLEEFLQNLVKMHAIDPAVFEAQGFKRPARSDPLGWGDFPHWQADDEPQMPDPVMGRQSSTSVALSSLLTVAKGADNYADYQIATAARVAE